MRRKIKAAPPSPAPRATFRVRSDLLLELDVDAAVGSVVGVAVGVASEVVALGVGVAVLVVLDTVTGRGGGEVLFRSRSLK
jgi:uncharacterized membrane protein (Fun14 family)